MSAPVSAPRLQDQGQRPLEPQPLRRLLQSPPQPQARGTARTRRATRIGPRSRRHSPRVALVRVLRRRRQPARPRLLHARGHAAPLRLSSAAATAKKATFTSADATTAKLRERACEGLWTDHRTTSQRPKSAAGTAGSGSRPRSPNQGRNPARHLPTSGRVARTHSSLSSRVGAPSTPSSRSANRKLHAGARVSDLTGPERDALRPRKPATTTAAACPIPAKRAEKRAKESARRLTPRPHQPNLILTQAREAAGYTLSALASALGVHRETVSRWERHFVLPRSQPLRLRVAQLLGCRPWTGSPTLDPTPRPCLLLNCPFPTSASLPQLHAESQPSGLRHNPHLLPEATLAPRFDRPLSLRYDISWSIYRPYAYDRREERQAWIWKGSSTGSP